MGRGRTMTERIFHLLCSIYFLPQIHCHVRPQPRGSLQIQTEVCDFVSCFFKSELLNLSISDNWGRWFSVWGLHTIGCLAASLAFTHWMVVTASPSQSWQSKLSPDIAKWFLSWCGEWKRGVRGGGNFSTANNCCFKLIDSIHGKWNNQKTPMCAYYHSVLYGWDRKKSPFS